MSELDYEESSSEHDFSDNSEDDWKPTQESSEDESDGGTQTAGSSSSPMKNGPTPPKAKKNSRKRVPVIAEKAQPTRTGKIMTESIRELLQKAKAGQRERLNLSVEAGPSQTTTSPKKPVVKGKPSPPMKEDDASSSSGDEYLVDPAELDLGSTFFKSGPSIPTENRIPTPNFDCGIGVGALSDSEGQDSESSTSKPTTSLALDNLQNLAKTIDEAKANLKKYEENKKATASTSSAADVGSLLALGETSTQDESRVKRVAAPVKRRRKSEEDSADSDWEEVEDAQAAATTIKDEAHGDVQFTLDLSEGRRAKLQNDLEVALKRQLNKEKRERQVLVHQSGFKEWLEQGNFINGILNNTTLFAIALKLLPSAQAYPKDKADLKYFEDITKWYKTTISLPSSAPMYPRLADDLDPLNSLRNQIEGKSANSKRDYVLIFIVLLRAIGIQCRMVINLVVPPIRPPQSELCRITTNPKAESSTAGKKKSATKRSAKKELSDPSDDDDEDYNEIAERLSSPKEKKRTTKKTDSKKVEEKFVSKQSTSDRKARLDSKLKADSSSGSKDKESMSKPEKKSSSKSTSNSSRTRSNESKDSLQVSPRKTRSRTPAKTNLIIPQVDGMDDVSSSPIGKRTRSRSKTPVPSLAKKLLSKESVDSPIKIKRNTKNTRNTLQVPKETKEITISQSSSELFAVDPTEKKTVPKDRKSPARPSSTTTKTKKRSADSAEDSSVPKKNSRYSELKKIDRRVLSTDEDENKSTTTGNPSKVDFWIEVWSEKEEKWMCVDLFKPKIDSTDTIIRNATLPIAYVLAWNNNSSIKDVSLRYCPQWYSVNKKMRTDQAFVDEELKPFIGRDEARDKKEDEEIQRLITEPLPKTVGDYKNHPKYALKRHLLKFEAIYPPTALSLHIVRGEEVYARECVHVLHSRELWVKQARVVKPGETPYKIVKARPKWERATNTVIKDLPLELFGVWQTMEYEPPVAENGIVPKNAYGNVELFKECMLPINTVHLPYNGLNKVCKRLQIDYAPAVVGFDFHSGYSHPVYEGYVVCQEFAEIVTDAWIKDTEEAAKREAEKCEERVYGNWKRLIKGLWIKKRLQLRYNFEEKDTLSAQN